MYNRFLIGNSLWNTETYMVNNEDIVLPSSYAIELCPCLGVTGFKESKNLIIGIDHPIDNSLEITKLLFLSYIIPNDYTVLEQLSLHDLCSIYMFVDAYFLPEAEDLMEYVASLKDMLKRLIKSNNYPENIIFQVLDRKRMMIPGEHQLIIDTLSKLKLDDIFTFEYKNDLYRIRIEEFMEKWLCLLLYRMILSSGTFKGRYSPDIIKVLETVGVNPCLIRMLK